MCIILGDGVGGSGWGGGKGGAGLLFESLSSNYFFKCSNYHCPFSQLSLLPMLAKETLYCINGSELFLFLVGEQKHFFFSVSLASHVCGTCLCVFG